MRTPGPSALLLYFGRCSADGGGFAGKSVVQPPLRPESPAAVDPKRRLDDRRELADQARGWLLARSENAWRPNRNNAATPANAPGTSETAAFQPDLVATGELSSEREDGG
ncbi:hypothetical protein [Lentzea flaviverrucosa]|uniref:hypothetical protein n=1 Tax=Lentzea flaviverrucosa TaxID=200379 RepID=UPI001160871B|nr:hypothetical protein [Lentzea flaviverrucosa]